ncbi:MAG: bifunctional diaminohydroxyphosphoribosylaminopyrimidine deaminase/5-amino-6-(5-phosphoribosylamino)uracil reductase RibD [Roseburia sp.]|nr:bifunctional diaminohydroxyphosphoribosylaminopyrimidine deaminase/5-amino-6-(5-phosphoribosylamino)uracil reductase RibD [Roseburia sp.]
MNDEEYMHLALELAQKGRGKVNPNPLVGAVIVKNGKIIGQGYHERYGELHAERNAFKNCTEPAKGATLYVTLEPCCHYGKTPPCTEAIIQNKIAKVVIGTLDPNPLMAGKSAALLRNRGIEVVVGVLEKECQRLIRVFRKYITTQRPYVLMKYAMTMDGKIATRTGASKWITDEDTRMHVQETRNEYCAIMVGVNTVIQDDPLLTCRLKDGRSPVRIICDTRLRTPVESQIVQTAKDVKTIIATSATDDNKKELYRKKSCIVLDVPQKDDHIDLAQLMQILGEQKIDSILLEGGGTLNWSALESGIVDAVQTYIAPKIFGGTAASPVNGLGVASPDEAYHLENSVILKIGNDFLIESEVKHSCLQEL